MSLNKHLLNVVTLWPNANKCGRTVVLSKLDFALRDIYMNSIDEYWSSCTVYTHATAKVAKFTGIWMLRNWSWVCDAIKYNNKFGRNFELILAIWPSWTEFELHSFSYSIAYAFCAFCAVWVKGTFYTDWAKNNVCLELNWCRVCLLPNQFLVLEMNFMHAWKNAFSSVMKFVSRSVLEPWIKRKVLFRGNKKNGIQTKTKLKLIIWINWLLKEINNVFVNLYKIRWWRRRKCTEHE